MKILVDLDGIVVDTLPEWLTRIYQTTGVRVSTQDIVSWNLLDNPQLAQLTPAQVFGILNEKDFTRYLPQMSDASFYLRKLHQAGHDISIVTARYGTNCMPETLEWLKETMPWFNVEKKTWFCYDKHRITGDVLIDDKAETLIQYRREHPQTKLITIDYPYNQHALADTHRVLKNGSEWEAIESYISKLDKEYK